MSEATGRLRGKIVEWRGSQGYGFLRSGDQRIFLHHRDYAGPHSRPSPGDWVSFRKGTDAQGRPCAKDIELERRGRGVAVLAMGIACILLAAPIWALTTLAIDWRWVSVWFAVVNVLVFLAYRGDQRAARLKLQRTPEKWLHIFELLGGWPAAFVAQRWLRHKCSKTGYQFVFWMIVLLHQATAIEILRGGKEVDLALMEIKRIEEDRSSGSG